jgi:uncharacterized membrane protein YoaK (UPF0700 family)
VFHHYERGEPIPKRSYVRWFLLAFLSGNLNAGGFLACGRFVTHVTGFATLFGIDAANGRWDQALGILSVPLFFLLGVMISAYLVDRPIQKGGKPHYTTVMGLVALCVFLCALAGNLRMFGQWGEALRLKQDYFLLALLCMASGLQNAAITTASGSTVRTTHLTGISTDLGIGIVRELTLIRDPQRHAIELQANWLRVGTILAYAAGSLVGAALFIRIEYLGFLLPCSIAIYAMSVAIQESHEQARIKPEDVVTNPNLRLENKIIAISSGEKNSGQDQ